MQLLSLVPNESASPELSPGGHAHICCNCFRFQNPSIQTLTLHMTDLSEGYMVEGLFAYFPFLTGYYCASDAEYPNFSKALAQKSHQNSVASLKMPTTSSVLPRMMYSSALECDAII